MFDAMGLGATEWAIYRQLLHEPELDEEGLAESLQLPAPSVHAAIRELQRLSLVRPSWENSRQVHPVSPDVGLGALVADRESQLLESQQEIERAKLAVAGFVTEYAEWRARTTRGEVEYLEGLDATRNRIDELVAGAEEEIVAFSMGAQTADTIDAGRRADKSALDRGLRLRSIYLSSIRNHPPSYAHAQWLVEQGVEVRTTPILPCRMVIFDKRMALLPIDPGRTQEGAVVLTGPGPLTVMLYLFETVWDEARSMSPQPLEREGAAFDSTELAVIRLLAKGMTDEAVARKLGVSLRTVRRITARLMRQLGTRSRFEAGCRVTQLDLI